MNHTQLLNHLAAKHNLTTYLELGVNNPNNNFNKIICEYRSGVDPSVKGILDINQMTSDEFFNDFNGNEKYDLILIDGLHHADQVERDFNNSLKCLNDGGFIVIHDCLPVHELTTYVPRTVKQWHGDVYKFAMKLHTIPGIDFITYDFDEGCCVVWKDPTKKGSKKKVKTDWESYKLNGRKLMNVTNELGESK